MTHIVMEQMEADISVHVNGREKRIWASTSKKDVLQVMADVKEAVTAMLNRLSTDVADNSLYLTFEVFDLHSWEALLVARRQMPSGSTELPADLAERYQQLQRSGRALFKALGLD